MTINKSRSVIYPGTFDPITYGHLDIITRAAKIFEPVIVAVSEHTTKQTLLSYKDRLFIARASLKFLGNVKVMGFQKLFIDFARRQKVFLMLRGIRSASDADYERQLLGINKALSAEIDAVFMPAQEKYAHISSSFVRDIARLGGDICAFVPPPAADKLNRMFKS